MPCRCSIDEQTPVFTADAFFFFLRGTQVKAQARGPLPKAVKLLVAGVTMMDQVFVSYATGQFIWDRASISASVLRWNVGSHFSEVWQAPRLRSPSYHMGAQQGHNISFRQEGKLSNHQVHPWQQSDESIATQCTERQKGTGWLTKSALLNYVCFDKVVAKAKNSFSTAHLRKKKTRARQQVKWVKMLTIEKSASLNTGITNPAFLPVCVAKLTNSKYFWTPREGHTLVLLSLLYHLFSQRLQEHNYLWHFYYSVTFEISQQVHRRNSIFIIRKEGAQKQKCNSFEALSRGSICYGMERRHM